MPGGDAEKTAWTETVCPALTTVLLAQNTKQLAQSHVTTQ